MKLLFALVVGFVGLLAADLYQRGQQASPLISSAEAVVGRPLTPVSAAGVARRSNRRDGY